MASLDIVKTSGFDKTWSFPLRQLDVNLIEGKPYNHFSRTKINTQKVAQKTNKKLELGISELVPKPSKTIGGPAL